MTYKPDRDAALGSAIKQLLAEKGLSQNKFAKLTGLGKDYVSKLVNGRIAEPRQEQRVKILQGLGISEVELQERIDRHIPDSNTETKNFDIIPVAEDTSSLALVGREAAIVDNEVKEVRFAGIEIDSNNCEWTEKVLKYPVPPFSVKYPRFFCLKDLLKDVDPCLNITVVNHAQKDVIITQLGIEIVCVAHQPHWYGAAKFAEKIPKYNYAISLPDLWPSLFEILDVQNKMPNVDLSKLDKEKRRFALKRTLGSKGFELTKISEKIFSDFDNSVLLEPERIFHYSLLLKDYQNNLPNHTIVQLWIQTDLGELKSDYLHFVSEPVFVFNEMEAAKQANRVRRGIQEGK